MAETCKICGAPIDHKLGNERYVACHLCFRSDLFEPFHSSQIQKCIQTALRQIIFDYRVMQLDAEAVSKEIMAALEKEKLI